MAFGAEVTSAVCITQVKVHLFVCLPSKSAHPLQGYLGREGIRPCGSDEASPCGIIFQLSPSYALEAPHLACSLLGPRCRVS